jgi:hypothetical protein
MSRKLKGVETPPDDKIAEFSADEFVRGDDEGCAMAEEAALA